MNLLKSYSQCLAKLQNEGLYRECAKHLTSEYKINLDFSTTDYMSLGQNPTLKTKVISALQKFGTGACGSRLLAHTTGIVDVLENAISDAKNTQAAMVFGSAFALNTTVIAALLNNEVLGETPIVFADKFIHASMIAGVQLSKAKMLRYKHLDLEHLETLLKRYKNYKNPKFILSETLFSVDGDFVDFAGITHLASKYGAFLYLDEAHEIGLYGDKGYGMSVNYSNKIDLVMGSFSKGLASFGGYLATSSLIKNYLVNKCSSFIYSNALPSYVVAASYHSWRLIPALDKQRKKIKSLALTLREHLKAKGFDIKNSNSHIVPIVLKNPEKTIQLRDLLRLDGIAVSAFRPPSVPTNSSRLRIAINAKHTKENILFLIDRLCHHLNV